MKKLIIPFLFLFTFFSCNRDDLQFSIKNESPVIEEQSEIALIEKEMGISFFKKDITLIDESGKNEVIVRIASKEEEVLREYLALYSLSISPVMRKTMKKVSPKRLIQRMNIKKSMNSQILMEFYLNLFHKNLTKML